MKNWKYDLFNLWMQQKHPLFYPITGLLSIISVSSIVVSIIFCFWFDWWWKATLVSFVFLGLVKIIGTLIIKYYVEEFNKNR